MTATLTDHPTPATEDFAPARDSTQSAEREDSNSISGLPSRNELMASACQKLNETSQRIERLQARLRSLGFGH